MTLPGPADWPVEDPLGDRSPDLLSVRAASTPDATALVDADTGESWTYAEFDERVDRRATALDSYLDSRTGRIGLLLDTSPAFAEIYFATERLGAAVVPFNLGLPVEALRRQADRADVECLVCEAATEGTAMDVSPTEAPLATVDAPEGDGIEPLDVQDGSATPSIEYSINSGRVVLFTSGTTGDPKGVRLTRRNLVASAVGSAYRLGVDPGDRWLVCLPMYHMGGLAPLVRSTLYGTTTVFQREFDAEATATVLDEYDVTGVSLVPTMLHRLLGAGCQPPDTLRFVLLGGAPASESLLERALDRGVPVYPTYGATETASQVATATPGEIGEYPGTVGRPLRGTDVSILDPEADRSGDADAALGPGERGEIVVSGPTVSPGYLDDDRTAEAFDEAGFHTGDLGHRDEAGRLWVAGRIDDRIVTGGENVHPSTVADALVGLPTVEDAVVVGLPDEEWGQRVAALVVLSDSADRPEVSDLRERLRGRVADYALPKTVAFADELPRTASGTVGRETVRELLTAAVEE